MTLLDDPVLRGAALRTDRELVVDAVVVGSGAGGAPVAKELAEAGLRVAILEEGDAHPPETLTARPREMTTRLYRDAGQVTTVGDPPIVLPLGRALGGTTLVNSGTCFRPPRHVLDRWEHEHGFPVDDLDEHLAHVERTINVTQVPPELAGRNALLVRDGAAALGVHGDFLHRNVRGCVGSGVCAYGCPAGAKQHAAQAWLPAAQAAGAITVTGARVRRIVVEHGRATGVEARTAAGARLRVRAPQVVLAAGTIHTPLLLRSSRLGGASGELGRNLSIHPATAARARFADEVRLWDGVPQSFHVDELGHDGILLEGIAGPPDYVAMTMPRSGPEHRELMLDARHLATFGVMVCDTARGSVRSFAGRPLIRYDLHPDDARRFRDGLELLARIWFAAGAQEVVVPVRGIPALRDGDTSALRDAHVRPRDLSLMAFHPLGTARSGGDPRATVCDEHGTVRGVRGVHVSDGSAVPGATLVNPQVTIMALAVRLAKHLAASQN